MPTQTTATQPAKNRALAEQIYDMIMGEIEPDLLLENIPHLAQEYADETSEEHEERMQRYATAYRVYDYEAAKLTTDMNQKARSAERMSLKKKEEQDRLSEQNVLQSLTSAIG